MSLEQIKRFEDLIAWQKARSLAKAIYEITQRGKFVRDYGLSSQLQRASVSIMSNIAEGYERGNPGDFYRFLCIAKASCAEVRSQLYLALDIDYIDQVEFNDLMRRAEEVGRVVGGLRTSVERQRSKSSDKSRGMSDE
jgi:four helix bundle protein